MSTSHINIDELFLSNKPAISDAKSSFFGLNNKRNYDDSDMSLLNNNAHSVLENTQILLTSFDKSNEVEYMHRREKFDETDSISECERLTEGNDSQPKQVSYHTQKNLSDGDKPSQTVYMTTTVPQNIKGNNIIGRHTPTRNSLRHSRMLVVNNHRPDILLKTNPINLQCPRVVKGLVTASIVCGVLLTCLCLWITLWAPSTRIQDNPYWSGLGLIFSGSISLIAVQFKRVPRHNLRETCFNLLKLNSLVFACLACVLTFVAFVFAIIHSYNLMEANKNCIPSKIFTVASDCICIFGLSKPLNKSGIIQNPENFEIPVNAYRFHYRDLSCSEVRSEWRITLLISAILNLIAFVTVCINCILFCFKRNKRKLSSKSDVASKL